MQKIWISVIPSKIKEKKETSESRGENSQFQAVRRILSTKHCHDHFKETASVGWKHQFRKTHKVSVKTPGSTSAISPMFL